MHEQLAMQVSEESPVRQGLEAELNVKRQYLRTVRAEVAVPKSAAWILACRSSSAVMSSRAFGSWSAASTTHSLRCLETESQQVNIKQKLQQQSQYHD